MSSFGLLDLPAPVFGWLDQEIGAWLAPSLRLALWGLVAAVGSMWLYRVLSPQSRIAAVKAEAIRARRALDAYDGDFVGAWPLMRRMFRLSFSQLGLVTWPAVVASLPALCLILWLSTAYGYGFPEPGEAVVARTFPEAGSAELVRPFEGGPGHIRVADGAGQLIDEFELPAPVGTLHKRVWWNALIGNPAGYLPADWPIERIEVDLPRKEYLAFGPDWARSWETLFFGVLLAASLAIKLAFRIE
jgi:hypothetical protein